MEITSTQFAELTSLDTTMAVVWAPVISETLRRFNLTTPQRAAAFLAQTAYESNNYTHLEENLTYSAHRLCEVWPHHFAMPPDKIDGRFLASDFAGQPERVGNLVYANRLGNGPYESGDGWKYRGRGLLQITGKELYVSIGRYLSLDLVNDPSLLTVPGNAARSAAAYWSLLGCSALADDGSLESFQMITQTINGALLGEEGREALWLRARNLLGC